MKIKELIEKLSAFDQEMIVCGEGEISTWELTSDDITKRDYKGTKAIVVGYAHHGENWTWSDEYDR